MVDYAIVTLSLMNHDFTIDMEIPTKVPMDELLPRLLEVLKEIEPSYFLGRDKIELFYQGNLLKRFQTFESEGIWDGKELMIR